ncbi:hypothetical protein [Paludifilum halophilum]|uniref:hypothetical protein n=1 Tax=Paludifilum halophilum TaxID=1642702 RepID=UPI00146CAF38|nr:hypothetical protein [Paludifilum halophilum]
MSVILLFIDGVGLGEEASHNPWYACPTPHMEGILGGSSLVRRAVGRHSEEAVLLEADASLGVEGLPQSATGQAVIFTGRNAPLAMGKHQSGLPFRRLRNWVQKDNIYLQFQKRGWQATFANSYTREYFDLPTTRRGWISVSTAAIQSAGKELRMLDDLLAGQAVYHDLTRWSLSRMRPEVKEIPPEEAADHLLGLTSGHRLVVHEYFLSDWAGHRKNEEWIRWVTHHYDRFLGALVRNKRKRDVIVLVSDHGNSEDFRIKSHTMNPVPVLVIGKVSPEVVPVNEEERDLTGIVPLLHRLVEDEEKEFDGKKGEFYDG